MGKKKKEELAVQKVETPAPYNEETGGEMDDTLQGGQSPDGVQYAELVKHLFNRKNINLITELKDQEIILLACLGVEAEEFDDDLLKNFILAYKELKVSRGRASRKELVEIFRTIASQPRPQNDGGVLGRAFGFHKEKW